MFCEESVIVVEEQFVYVYFSFMVVCYCVVVFGEVFIDLVVVEVGIILYGV